MLSMIGQPSDKSKNMFVCSLRRQKWSFLSLRVRKNYQNAHIDIPSYGHLHVLHAVVKGVFFRDLIEFHL